ncbi:hypothetical protein CASFOL_011129 [Castilleja foliolosa]|uniref:Uncharacterized protein n=1 Tax=Castilleja foliolosa TaxID=1961234 RepID=A0ABD3DYD0_9LAMI
MEFSIGLSECPIFGSLYNATGHTWEGSVWRVSYPPIIQNGQWGAFLHVRGRVMGPSHEAAMYSGQNLAGATRVHGDPYIDPKLEHHQ